MSEMLLAKVEAADGAIRLLFEEALYPRDAVFGAAYTFLDRAFVHLDREGTKLVVRLQPKPGATLSAEQVAGEFENEALAQAWRRDILTENRALIESLTSRALAGAAGPPGLDDLLDPSLGDEADAFDDPLGIAVSWEEKYGNKAEPEAAPGQAESASSVKEPKP